MLNAELSDAGFSDDKAQSLEHPEERTPAIVRLSEIKQLIVPIDAKFPRELADITSYANDLVELGHQIYTAEVAEKKVIILAMTNDVASIALQYPSMFRLAPAVLRNVPGVEYAPRFNQAVFGCNDVTWAYLVDALELDDRLKFDLDAQLQSDDSDLDVGDGNDA